MAAKKDYETDESMEVSVSGPQLVTIHLREDIKFKHGEIWYDLKAGMQKVPKGVKESLKIRGVLIPL